MPSASTHKVRITSPDAHHAPTSRAKASSVPASPREKSRPKRSFTKYSTLKGAATKAERIQGDRARRYWPTSAQAAPKAQA